MACNMNIDAEPAEPAAMCLLTETLQAMQKNQLMIMEKLFGTSQPLGQPGPSSIPITISLPTCIRSLQWQ